MSRLECMHPLFAFSSTSEKLFCNVSVLFRYIMGGQKNLNIFQMIEVTDVDVYNLTSSTRTATTVIPAPKYSQVLLSFTWT